MIPDQFSCPLISEKCKNEKSKPQCFDPVEKQFKGKN